MNLMLKLLLCDFFEASKKDEIKQKRLRKTKVVSLHCPSYHVLDDNLIKIKPVFCYLVLIPINCCCNMTSVPHCHHMDLLSTVLLQ